MTFKSTLTIALSLVVLAVSITITIWYTYTQEYVQDSKSTATKGIFFQKTLQLEQYKLVSTGNSWLGQYDRYTRSDRMGDNDALTIYCKDYCSKD